MTNSSARFPVNAYLLNEGAGNADVAAIEAQFSTKVPLVFPDGTEGSLTYGWNSATPPWIASLFTFAAQPGPPPESTNVYGVLFLKVASRRFAVTFGQAWQRIPQSLIERNFGIRCVLNLADADSLRAIRRDRVAEDSIQAIEQIPDSDNIYRFGIDIERDLLRGVKARIDPSKNFGAWVAGADSFKGSVDLTKESIPSYLRRCLSLSSSQAYKTNFAWIDNIQPIKDIALVEVLDSALASQLVKNPNGLVLCTPDLLSWDDYDYFSFWPKKRNASPCASHLDLSQWISAYKAEKGPITSKSLTEARIYAYRNDDTLARKWPVKECLHGLVIHKKTPYLAHGGSWYSLDKSFVAEVDSRVASIPDTCRKTLVLPNTTFTEKEGDYNLRAASLSGSALLCLDKKLIGYGGGKSRIEVCDLLSSAGHLICVKPWGGGSSSLSHLFQQARISAQLMSDANFTAKAATTISSLHSSFGPVWTQACSDPAKAEIVLATLRGCKKSSLPFFARLALSNCVDDLRRMRFKVSYTVIDP